MCIAIYVPTGKNIKDEQIRNAFANNGDGAGVMHYDKYGRVQYSKGFMTVESLLAYWHNNTTDKFPRAIHCRIATSGKVSKGCCHPFPITDNIEDMMKPHGKSKTGCIMHNGVFTKYTPKEGMLSPYSDTMVFTKKVIYPLREILNNTGVDELMSDITSRVLVFLPNYEVHKYGTWKYNEEDGFYASNDTYEYDDGWKTEWKKWYSPTTYLSDDYVKPYSYTTTGNTTATFSLDKKFDNYYNADKYMTDEYVIAVSAKTMDEAYDMVSEFIDTYWNSLMDNGWDALDTLESTGENEWMFYCYAHQDISKVIDKDKFIIVEHVRFDEDGNEIIGGDAQ